MPITQHREGILYWIHLPEHKCIGSEGYVGITVDPTERFRRHKREALNGSKTTIYNAFRKYGDRLIMTALYSGTYDTICEMEKLLRPEFGIGWNLAVGGRASGLGVDRTDHISEAGKDSIRDKLSKTQKHPWENRRIKDHSYWAMADYLYTLYNLDGYKSKKIASVVGCNWFNINVIIKYFNRGWVPREDKHWRDFQSEYNKEVA